MKIVSLVPSITKTLFDFGLSTNEIIGRTKFCIHPEEKIKNVDVIGGTKNLNIEKIKSLNPDIIIANKEENEKGQILELSKDFNVWTTDVGNIEDQKLFITELGRITGREDFSRQTNLHTDKIFNSLAALKPNLKTAYLIWQKPYMTVGGDTFIHDILQRLGFQNIFKNKNRYPETDLSKLAQAEVIMLSTEPYPFKAVHAKELQEQLPHAKVLLVDGEAFSWYGTHLLKCADYYKKLLLSFREL